MVKRGDCHIFMKKYSSKLWGVFLLISPFLVMIVSYIVLLFMQILGKILRLFFDAKDLAYNNDLYIASILLFWALVLLFLASILVGIPL